MSEAEASAEPPPWSRRKKLKVAGLIAVTVIGCTLIWFRMSYPYGVSHCCSAGIGLGLRQYALDHKSWYPNGMESPEASFSKLYPEYENSLRAVRGKNIPLEAATAAWKRDGHLGPDSCGWHYVEGLNENDDPSIAVVWDKAWGLGHNGQRIRGFGREIILTDGSNRGILVRDWPKFAFEQRAKLAKLIAARGTNGPPIRWSDEESLGTNWFPVPK